MSRLIHHTPTVGSLIKKVMAINPELTAQEMIQIVKESLQTQGEVAGEFASAERVDEEKALRLARLRGQKK